MERARQYKSVVCCGMKLVCDRFTNTCPKCGADFNMSGSRLAPREQWGEETGESYSDILMADADYEAGRFGEDD